MTGCRLTREELISALRQMAALKGESITVHEFREALRISDRQVYRHFKSWRELREAAGLNSPRAPVKQQFSDRELIDQLRRVVQRLGRFPSEMEFDTFANCCYATLKKRFGGTPGIRRRLKCYEEYVDAMQEWQASNPQPLPPSRWDVDWLKSEWAKLRIGYELSSSDLKGRTELDIDLLFCLEHDWPACPVKVIEVNEVLRRDDPSGSFNTPIGVAGSDQREGPDR